MGKWEASTKRLGAFVITSDRTFEDAGREEKASGYELSGSALQRNVERTADNPTKRSKDDNVEAAIAKIAAEIAEELDILDRTFLEATVRDWFVLIELDTKERGAKPDDPMFEDSRRIVSEIIDKHSKPQNLLEELVRASAMLHMARNPLVAPSDRPTLMRDGLSILLSPTFGEMIALYRGASIIDLLHSDRKPFSADYRSDTTGLLCSTALHLISQAYFALSKTKWVAYIQKLKSERLLPMLLVRGVAFKDIEPLINVAEAAYEVGEHTLAAEVLLYVDREDQSVTQKVKNIWQEYLDADFVDFALTVLSDGFHTIDSQKEVQETIDV